MLIFEAYYRFASAYLIWLGVKIYLRGAGDHYVDSIRVVQPIQLLEYPIPPHPPRPSQKPSHGDISGTKSGIIDPLVSKRPGKN